MSNKRVLTVGLAVVAIAVLIVGTFQLAGANEATGGGITAASNMYLTNTDMTITSAETDYTLRSETTGLGGEALRGAMYNSGEAVRGYGGDTSYAGFFAGWTGVYGWTDNANGDAVYGYVPSTSGTTVWAGRFQNYETTNTPRGVYVTSAGYTALYSQADPAHYDGYFPGKGVYATAYFGGTQGTIAFNAGDNTLNQGDLLTISGVTMRPDGQPALSVRKAARGDEVVGVMVGKVIIDTGTVTKYEVQGVADKEGAEAAEARVAVETPRDNYMADGPVAAGEYAALVTGGLVQVNAAQLDMSRARVGSPIGIGGAAIGLLADAQPDAQGLVWVYIGGK